MFYLALNQIWKRWYVNNYAVHIETYGFIQKCNVYLEICENMILILSLLNRTILTWNQSNTISCIIENSCLRWSRLEKKWNGSISFFSINFRISLELCLEEVIRVVFPEVLLREMRYFKLQMNLNEKWFHTLKLHRIHQLKEAEWSFY